MQIYITNQFSYLSASALFGIVVGLIYNLLNFLLLFLKKSKKLLFFSDMIFCIILSIMFAVSSYSFNYGIYRWYAILITLSVLNLFNCTIGVYLIRIESIFVNLVKRACVNLIKVLDISIKFVKIIIVGIRIERYSKKLKYDLLRAINQERKNFE